MRAYLKSDAPQRYTGALEVLGRVRTAMEGLVWEGKKANCSLKEALAIWQGAFDMEMRLLEHGVGKPTETKEVKEERKLLIGIVGWEPTKFQLPPAVTEAVSSIVEGEVRDMGAEVPSGE